MKKQSLDRLKIWGSQIKEKLIVGCWRKSFRKERENEKVKDESEETTIIHMRLYTTDNMSKDILGCWKNCQYYKVFQKMSWPQFTFEFLSLGHVNNVINNIILNFFFFLKRISYWFKWSQDQNSLVFEFYIPDQANPKTGYKFKIINYVRPNYKRSKSLRKI